MIEKYIIVDQDDVTVDILSFNSKKEVNTYLKEHPKYNAIAMSDLDFDPYD